MAALRRFVIALAVLAVFAGLASAQASIPMNCSVSGTNANIRLESKTEKAGDITIICTGGSVVPDGAAIQRLTFTVTTSTGITSKTLYSTGSVTEALLGIDEPGTGGSLAPGFGPDQAATPCATNTGLGCTSAAFKESSPLGYPVMSTAQTAGGTAGVTNVFQGVLGTNTLTFNGVPVLAPVSNGVARLYRISNIRVDGTALTSGATVTASVAVTGTGSSGLISVPATTVTIGTAAAGLDGVGTAVSSSTSSPVCVTTGSTTAPVQIATVSFKEGFANAFRTRQVANDSVATALSNSLNLQKLPNADYSTSESGWVLTGLQDGAASTGGTSALADFGTRLKASFSNLPTGVHVFVSTTNIINGAAATVLGGGIANSATNTSYAQLIAISSNSSLEGVSDGTTGAPVVASSVTNIVNGINLAEITNTATAVWEVTNQKPGSIETLQFAVYISYAANVPPVTGGTTPSPTVTLSFGPTTGTGVTVVPRFAAGSISGKVFDLTSCRTVLLYPFLTSTTFETGIAIANTTTDPFTTGHQAGACHLYFYGTNPPTNPINTPSIASGGQYANTVGGLGAPGFQGYMIAICDFQFAHGFAFISQSGSPYTGNMGYLPLVIPDPGTGSRSAGATAQGEQLNN